MKVVEIQTILNNLRQHLTVIPSDFNNIYLKYLGILQNLMRNYEILRKFMKVDESYRIPLYFLVKSLPCFCSVSFNCDVLFAFCNFVLWWTKFFCLLLYCFASRQYRQIFRHHQMIGDISNIADTYSMVSDDLKTCCSIKMYLYQNGTLTVGLKSEQKCCWKC
jgi:hypothetical protein